MAETNAITESDFQEGVDADLLVTCKPAVLARSDLKKDIALAHQQNMQQYGEMCLQLNDLIEATILRENNN